MHEAALAVASDGLIRKCARRLASTAAGKLLGICSKPALKSRTNTKIIYTVSQKTGPFFI